MTGATVSVVMPAHDEERVIGRALATLTRGALPGEIEIVVVPNGCSDRTATVARECEYPVTVAEIETPSKIAALNRGDAVATAFPRVYLDADIEMDIDGLRALRDTLADHDVPLIASPRLRIDDSRSNTLVRAHYRIWRLSDYVRTGHVGSGVYGLSRAGREMFRDFPDVIADDRYVQQLFSMDQRVTTDGEFVVRAPVTFRALVRRSTRAAAGNLQLADRGLAGQGGSGPGGLVRRVLRRPTLWPSFLVYCVAYVIPRLGARRKLDSSRARVWDRDETSRR